MSLVVMSMAIEGAKAEVEGEEEDSNGTPEIETLYIIQLHLLITYILQLPADILHLKYKINVGLIKQWNSVLPLLVFLSLDSWNIHWPTETLKENIIHEANYKIIYTKNKFGWMVKWYNKVVLLKTMNEK